MTASLPDHMQPTRSFQGLILTLHNYWAEQGCVILQPYDMEVGAGTFHPATTLRSLGPKPWKAAYVQPSRRPKDGRYGENPNRLQHYYQYQVIMKPSPPNLQELYLGSLRAIGLDRCCTISVLSRTTGRARPSAPGALAGNAGATAWKFPNSPISSRSAASSVRRFPARLTYGLERLAMYVQGVDNVYDLNFNGLEGDEKVTYGDVFLQAEQEYSRHNFEPANTAILLRHFEDAEAECEALLRAGAPGG